MSKNTIKSRDELLDMFRNELIELIAMTIQCEGHPEVLEYSQEMENIPQKLFFILPEYSTYTLTIKYRVTAKPLVKLTYYQVVKKGGIPFKSRKEEIANTAVTNDDTNPHHTVTFPPDDIPGGTFIRGTYPAVSTFYAEGKPIFSTEWAIKVVKRGTQPSIGY
ncbi:E set domain-containing protein [Yamadazyma tenuis ATCC 10573]|uniref:E set domain-containing protein n=1 Tax=Candida tenuis (strain ATCC 10573 / BCRC 21748 / CBS 615 / JCM 9827 / NBRC 10315 / NRRL Y-1498 / VKM Y-70) TaxID=590646 RepID=G3AZF8_CANTC|nr:E set domain-containing protein [Yamadazyma tenuis ATCC 10573]EGV66085.1 E set domain-containing protein [Yamadazyma tenuis ATCC 10573]